MKSPQYYSQPTNQQVIDAAEMLFVERIDVAAEAVRSPEEIGRMLREAEGQIGALTEVIGGTCVVSNLCPAKFACIGCSGNAPDPERRYQIETKRCWATEQITWARREHLPAEERQMTRVVQDCELLLEEMTLIERARVDQRRKYGYRRSGAMRGGNDPRWLAAALGKEKGGDGKRVERAVKEMVRLKTPVTLEGIRNTVKYVVRRFHLGEYDPA